jgi:hypothetical protein
VVESPKGTERVLDHVSAFDPQFQVIWVALDRSERDVDLFELLPCWVRRGDVDVHRPELGADHSPPEPLQIGVARRGRTEIVRGHIPEARGSSFADRTGKVVVSIDEWDLGQDLAYAL